MATIPPITREELSEQQGFHLLRETDLFVDWVLLWLERRELDKRGPARKPPQAPEAERVELGA